MSLLRVVGMDPSLRNWGIAIGTYNPATEQILIERLDVVQGVELEGKQVRQNSKDVHIATQLHQGAFAAMAAAQALFIEVPVGSQSARSMASYGICVGVLGALRSTGTAFYELTPTEVKLAGAGSKTASKQEMINWAVNAHPEAPWPTQTIKGERRIIEGKAEHMADAVAAIHAGVKTLAFKQALAFWSQTNPFLR